MRYAEKGFTIIELLMVILIVAVLAAVALPQFIDFRTEARDTATNSALGALRTGIANQAAQMKLRCNAVSGTWPSRSSIFFNDVVVGGNCSIGQVVNPSARQVVAGPSIPPNPWGALQSNMVFSCVGAATGCDQSDSTDCDGNPYTPAADGWCYNVANGQIWANSQNSTGPLKENEF